MTKPRRASDSDDRRRSLSTASRWFTAWPDDTCSVCRRRLPEDEVPLILWKDMGAQTWQAQFCETCTLVLLEMFNTRATRN